MDFDTRDIAQTNLQLYRQLSTSGAADAIPQMAACYRVAAQIMGGQFRSTGKTLLAHHVGTASLTFAQTQDPQTTAGALLHAAFSHGVFPGGHTGLTPAHGDWLASQTSAEIAGIARRFGLYRGFRKDLLAGHIGGDPAPADEDILTIRLANQIDDALHGADQIGGKSIYNDSDILNAVAESAARMGLPRLASAAQAVRAENEAIGNPGVLQPVTLSPYPARPKRRWWRL